MSKLSPFKPSVAVLCKLGSIVVHAEEGISARGHDFDWEALKSLLADPEVRGWLDEMEQLAFLPVRRNK